MIFAVICSGYRKADLRLQPWRYLAEVVTGLRSLGHAVTVVTDGDADPGLEDTVFVRSVRLPKIGNPDLERRLDAIAPDVCLWNFGLTSALHFAPRRLRWRSFAVFTSPMYRVSEIVRLGPQRLMRSREYAAIHLLGAMVPRRSIRRALAAFDGVIVQSSHLLNALTDASVDQSQMHLVPPGVDDGFRTELPMPPPDAPFTVLYMGSPLPIRGVFDLVEAVALVENQLPCVRLRVLSRGHGEYDHHERDLLAHIRRLGLERLVTIRSGFLARADLRGELEQAHMVALPFQIVPADAPLAVLESMALGRPVLATRVASLPDYLSDGRGYLADPGRPASLAATLLTAASDDRELAATRTRALAYSEAFPSWPAVGARVRQVLERVAGDTS